MRTLVAAVLLVLAALPVTAQSRVAGSRAIITPPAGYAPAEGFAGFQNARAQAALMVVEIEDASLSEMRAAMTDEAFLSQGFRVRERREVTVNGVSSLYAEGTQAQGGQTFTKYVLLSGDDNGVILVNATIPTSASVAQRNALAAAALTLSWGEASPADLFEGLAFTLDLPEALAGRRRLGASILAAERIGPGPGGDPVYIVAPGAQRLPASLAAVAETTLRQTAARPARTRPGRDHRRPTRLRGDGAGRGRVGRDAGDALPRARPRRVGTRRIRGPRRGDTVYSVAGPVSRLDCLDRVELGVPAAGHE